MYLLSRYSAAPTTGHSNGTFCCYFYRDRAPILHTVTAPQTYRRQTKANTTTKSGNRNSKLDAVSMFRLERHGSWQLRNRAAIKVEQQQQIFFIQKSLIQLTTTGMCVCMSIHICIYDYF